MMKCENNVSPEPAKMQNCHITLCCETHSKYVFSHHMKTLETRKIATWWLFFSSSHKKQTVKAQWSVKKGWGIFLK